MNKLVPTLLLLLIVASAHAAISPADLRCEYAENPLGVDGPHPRLFWKLESRQCAERQTAYQIIAASSLETLAKNSADLWDSGKVQSDDTIQIPYAGRELQSWQQVFWKVRVWDAGGKTSSWSKPATWTMGVLTNADWRAQWISAPDTNFETLVLRREFFVKPGLKRALAAVCGLGQYEIYLNGKKSGDDILAPGWTDYRKTCLYDLRDLTPLLRSGTNAAGLLLGNGMYDSHGGRFAKFKGSFGLLKAIAQIRLEYADGSVDLIGTGTNWRVTPGPITFSSPYGGEDFDARLVQRGWKEPNFDDSKWPRAETASGPGGELEGLSCAAPPIHAFEILKPAAKRELTSNITVYDLGQNAAVMARFTVRGAAGSVVRVIPAELVETNGFVDRGSCGGKRGLAYWQYTLAGGDGDEDYFSRFFYHGCRYLQVELMPASTNGPLPELKKLEGVVIHSASAPVGEFSCSNDLFNRIRTLVRWAQKNNMVSLMTDCPHRERLGWLEQDHLNGPSLRYEFDLAQLFTKQMNDMADAQTADGLVPDIAPEYTVFKGGFRDSLEWGSACVIVPWQQYEFDADLTSLEKNYDTMKSYVAYVGTTADTNHIVNHGLGDWYDIGPKGPGVAQLTPISLTATAFYYYDTWILSQVAGLLGKTNDAAQFSSLANLIRVSFNQTFLAPTHDHYATGSQTANAIPLVMNLCDASNRPAILDNIVADIRARGNALTSGDVGYQYLLRALADGGRSDVIFDMNNQSEKPGYGYQLKMGATSLTEAWNAARHNSQDHFMLGQIEEWFYHDLAGIGCDPSGPGFKKIVIRPQPVGDITWVKCGYDSIRGKIVCDWERDAKNFTLHVTIPPNTTARVYVPSVSADSATTANTDVTLLSHQNGAAIYEILSGPHTFHSRLP